jgi:hypothetical protein
VKADALLAGRIVKPSVAKTTLNVVTHATKYRRKFPETSNSTKAPPHKIHLENARNNDFSSESSGLMGFSVNWGLAPNLLRIEGYPPPSL